MMAAATVDMNQKIILFNLDIIEEQRRQMYHAVDQYVDKVIDAGRQWTTRRERSHSTFLEIHKITSNAMFFLSLKCDKLKSELESETSHLIGRDEFTQQQKNAQMDSVAKPATIHGKGKEDDTDDVKKNHTSRNPNLESDQQTRYQDVYNQLKSVLAKQDELEQQLNMKLNILREDTESLKSDVGTFNQYVETGKTLLDDYSQKLESLENTVSCLSGKGNEMYSHQQVLVDRINSHLSDKDDQVNRDLSAKVDQTTTDITDKVDQVRDLSAKVGQITTDMTDKVDLVNKDLSAKVCQMNKDLTAKVCQINTDFSAKVFQMNTDLSAKVNQTNTELSHKVDEINTDLSAKVGQISTDLSDKVIEINTDLSAKVDQINVVLQTLTNSEKEHAAQMKQIIDLKKHFNMMEKDTQNNDKDLSAKVRQMNTDLSAKVNQMNTELSHKVDEINTDLSAKVGQISTDLSDKVIEINTDLSAKVDQINVLLQTLRNSEKEHAAQMNKKMDLEKHFNTLEKDTQNNDKKVQQQMDEVGRRLLDLSQKLTQLSVGVATKSGENLSNKVDQINTDLSAKVDQINVVLHTLTNSKNEHAAQIKKMIDLEKHCNDIAQQQHDELLDVMKKLTQLSVGVDKKRDLGAVGFKSEAILPPGSRVRPVTMFEPPAFILEFRFHSDTGMFTASSGGFYLAYVSMCLDEDGCACVKLIHGQTGWYDEDEDVWQGNETQICSVRAERKGSTMCSLDMIEMEKEDRLFIFNTANNNVSCRIQFLCFRIG